MWSDRYRYYGLFPALYPSGSETTQRVVSFLQGLPELTYEGNGYFANSGLFPFVRLTLLHSQSKDSFSSKDFNTQKCNHIDVIGSRDDGSSELYAALLEKIARALHWHLSEETESGNIFLYP